MARPRATKAARLDSFVNEVTKLGDVDRDVRLQSYAGAHAPRGEAELSSLLQSAWAARRISEAIVDDALRRGFDVRVEDDDDGQIARRVSERLEAWRAVEQLELGLKLARAYGGALIVLVTGDQAQPSQPMAQGAELRRLLVFQRFRVESPGAGDLDENIGSPTYGERLQWRLFGAPGTIHASRVIALRGLRVSDDHVVPSNGIDREVAFWGQSVIDHAWDELRRFDTCWAYAEGRFKDLAQTVLKISGLKRMLAEKQRETVLGLLRLYQASRSSLNAAAVDGEDDIEDRVVSLEHFVEVAVQLAENLAAAARMPLTKLFGHAPAGLSTDDASGTRNWDDEVQSYQTRTVTPPLRKLIELALVTEGAEGRRFDLAFRPLRQPTEGEIAELREKRSTEAQALWDIGAISADEVRESVRADAGWIRLSGAEDARREAERKAVEASEASPDTADRTNVSAVVEILQQAADGQLPRETAVAMLVNFFGLTPDAAEATVASIGAGFERPEPKASPSPPPSREPGADGPEEPET